MRRSLVIASAAAALAGATPLAGQGSGVDQQSACMTGRVGAGVAAPCDDASAVYFSPAGLALHGSVVSAGASIVSSGATFHYDAAAAGSDPSVKRETETVAVPQAFLSYRAGSRLAVGVGVFAPFGLGLEWPVCSADQVPATCGETNFEGRFTGYDNYLRALFVQPTVAYQAIPDFLTVGVGVAYVMTELEVHRRQFGPAALGLGRTEVVDVELAGDGTGFTANLGAILSLGEDTRLGVRYLFPTEVDVDGDAVFTQVPTGVASVDALVGAGLPSDQGVGTTVEFPGQLVMGVSHRFTPALMLLADLQRTYWSSFDAFEVRFAGNAPLDSLNLNYDDTWTLRLAGDYRVNDALNLRAGFRYNTAATPAASPLLPEGERNYYTLGLGYRASRALSADLAFQYVNQPDREGTLIPGEPRAGVFEASGMVFGFTLAYRFGGGMEP